MLMLYVYVNVVHVFAFLQDQLKTVYL